jgi:hypothetical protein
LKSYEAGKIWTLGAHATGIGKSLSWRETFFPSFDECDVLIVDTTTLDENTIKSLTFDRAQNLFDEITRRIKTGLTVICILSKTFATITNDSTSLLSNYFWSPFGFWFDEIPASKSIKPIRKFPLENYIKKIKELKIALKLKPYLKDRCQSDDSLVKLMANPVPSDHLIQDTSDTIFGGMYYVHDEISSGVMILLPPLENSEKSIQAILEELGVSNETLP